MTSALPAVIAGLAVGIGFVVVFSIFFTPSMMNSDGSSSAVTLGEEGQTIHIDFTISLPERDMIVKKGETVRGTCYNRDLWKCGESPEPLDKARCA